jgi:hypothetical protein
MTDFKFWFIFIVLIYTNIHYYKNHSLESKTSSMFGVFYDSEVHVIDLNFDAGAFNSKLSKMELHFYGFLILPDSSYK